MQTPPSPLYWPGRLLRAQAAAWLPLLMLAACAPDLGALPRPKPAQDYGTQQSFAAPGAQWPQADWWKAYGDAALNQLMDEALAGAPDLKIAEARLRESEAARQQAGSKLWPTLTANGSASQERQSLNNGFPKFIQTFLPHGYHSQGQVTANLDYEVDLFGKNRAALAAATSESDAAKVDLAESRLALSTAVASAYASLSQLAADQAAAEDAVRVRKASADLFASRVTRGLENRGAAAEAEARVGDAQSDADRIAGQIAHVRDQLAALVGKGPDRGLDIPLPHNARIAPFGVPASLPADLLGRRPDVVAARLRADAAGHRIDVAHADFYPNIDLSASMGYQSIGITDLISPASRIGQIGPAVHLPIFDGGQIEGAYRGARAEYDEAVATYDKTLTGALQDVADALADERELSSELGHARAAQTASEDAWRIAKLRYDGGLSRYLDVLTAEDTLVTERRAVADLEARAFVDDVALVRALGGGFKG